VAIARPIPRLAPVTMLTGFGKCLVDAFRNFLEGEGFDERFAVHEYSGGVHHAARDSVLVIALHRIRKSRIGEGRDGCVRVDIVRFGEIRQPGVEISLSW
jgi:hypothetical protein